MNYSNLFSKAWNLVWNNKFLIVLGIIVSLGWGGTSSTGSQSVSDGNFHFGPRFSGSFDGFGLPIAAVLVILFFLLIFAALWAVGLISRGGLIYGADVTSKGQSSSFGDSFQAGLKKGWRLIGIGLVPAIPVVLLVVIAAFSFSFYQSGVHVTEGIMTDVPNTPNISIVFPIIIVAVLMIFLVLSLLRTFAERACMLEDTGVFGSYRRGMQVLGNNLGSAIVLFLLQVLISIVLGLGLILPGIIAALCCFLWPVLIAAQGAFAAFYSTTWTLSWNEWTGNDAAEVPAEL